MISQWLRAQQSNDLTILSISCVLLTGILDYYTGTELSFSIFYLFPIILISWYVGGFRSFVIVVLCSVMWAYADLHGGHAYSSWYIFAFDTFVRFGIFCLISFLIARLKHEEDQSKSSELLTQKTYDVITTSQHITAVIASRITQQNSELWMWIVEQKKNGARIPEIVERTCRNISVSIASLTETCFSFQPQEKDPVNIEHLIDAFKAKLDEYGEEKGAASDKPESN